MIEQFDNWVTNIQTAYLHAIKLGYGDALKWYEDAHKWAQSLADEYGLEVERVTAITAVLSPQKKWDFNKLIVEKLLADHNYAIPTFKANAQKALNILFADDLPNAIDNNVKGKKVSAFYRSLTNPQNSLDVVVDRHAIRIANGDTEATMENARVPAKLYNPIADAYRYVADAFDITPLQLQAVTWVYYLEEVR